MSMFLKRGKRESMQRYKNLNGHKNTNMFVCRSVKMINTEDNQNYDTISDYEILVTTHN